MSELLPCNDFILVKPQVDEKSKGGIVLVQSEKTQRPDKGEILAVGPGKYVNGLLEPMRLKPGQVILFQQYPFFEFHDKGERVLLVRELQVCAVLK